MPDVLNQSQIDALLNSLSSGGTEAIEEKEIEAASEKKVKNYDFYMPKKFTKEKLKAVDNIFEIYARLLSSFLTGLMRLYCKVEVLQIEEQRYYEYNNALPDYVLMSMINMGIDDEDISDTNIIMQLSNPVAYTIMDRVLGGFGNYLDVNRDFTEIETNIMKDVLRRMVSILKESWAGYLDINPVMTSLETNARVIQSIGPDDIVILVMLEVEIRSMKNTISICIPAINLEEMMAKFTDKYTALRGKRYDANREAERKEEILKGIKDTGLRISAILSETQISLFDILTMQVNDVIPLDVGIDENVVIKVGNQVWFDGKLGVRNGKKAVRIDTMYKN